ncbi:hypothetical protein HYH03_008978 [Edaphochlamys debaryana]|uniref:Protein kinase domain-containing protein n=1 Tax=Edaphochlamys debaryana TaxID=47281 RepID=A0A836BXR0_9CHLO|nr:hypothetical protein HYH03_008978 [Edaphochlamys debaryana]|eukprot:KAG2492820.1 hypothetical protein HYH03_008978 [Edaphochlamys debaryana]
MMRPQLTALLVFLLANHAYGETRRRRGLLSSGDDPKFADVEARLLAVGGNVTYWESFSPLLKSRTPCRSSASAPLRIGYLTRHTGTLWDWMAVAEALELDWERRNPDSWYPKYGMSAAAAADVWRAQGPVLCGPGRGGGAGGGSAAGDAAAAAAAWVDALVVCDTVVDARPLLQGGCGLPIVLQVTNRYDWKIKDAAEYGALMAAAAANPRVWWVTNSPFEQLHMAWNGLALPPSRHLLLRPLGATVLPPPPPGPERAATFAVILKTDRKRHPDRDVLLPQLRKLGLMDEVKVYDSIYGGPAALAQHRGVVHLPYQMSIMSLYETLAVGGLFLVPSPSFFRFVRQHHRFAYQFVPLLARAAASERQAKKDAKAGSSSSDASASGAFGAASDDMTHGVAGPDGLMGRNWTHYVEWYNPDFKEALVYFDSWEQLAQLMRLPAADPLWAAKRAEGRRAMARPLENPLANVVVEDVEVIVPATSCLALSQHQAFLCRLPTSADFYIAPSTIGLLSVIAPGLTVRNTTLRCGPGGRAPVACVTKHVYDAPGLYDAVRELQDHVDAGLQAYGASAPARVVLASDVITLTPLAQPLAIRVPVLQIVGRAPANAAPAESGRTAASASGTAVLDLAELPNLFAVPRDSSLQFHNLTLRSLPLGPGSSAPQSLMRLPVWTVAFRRQILTSRPPAPLLFIRDCTVEGLPLSELALLAADMFFTTKDKAVGLVPPGLRPWTCVTANGIWTTLKGGLAPGSDVDIFAESFTAKSWLSQLERVLLRAAPSSQPACATILPRFAAPPAPAPAGPVSPSLAAPTLPPTTSQSFVVPPDCLLTQPLCTLAPGGSRGPAIWAPHVTMLAVQQLHFDEVLPYDLSSVIRFISSDLEVSTCVVMGPYMRAVIWPKPNWIGFQSWWQGWEVVEGPKVVVGHPIQPRALDLANLVAGVNIMTRDHAINSSFTFRHLLLAGLPPADACRAGGGGGVGCNDETRLRDPPQRPPDRRLLQKNGAQAAAGEEGAAGLRGGRPRGGVRALRQPWPDYSNEAVLLPAPDGTQGLPPGLTNFTSCLWTLAFDRPASAAAAAAEAAGLAVPDDMAGLPYAFLDSVVLVVQPAEVDLMARAMTLDPSSGGGAAALTTDAGLASFLDAMRSQSELDGTKQETQPPSSAGIIPEEARYTRVTFRRFRWCGLMGRNVTISAPSEVRVGPNITLPPPLALHLPLVAASVPTSPPPPSLPLPPPLGSWLGPEGCGAAPSSPCPADAATPHALALPASNVVSIAVGVAAGVAGATILTIAAVMWVRCRRQAAAGVAADSGAGKVKDSSAPSTTSDLGTVDVLVGPSDAAASVPATPKGSRSGSGGGPGIHPAAAKGKGYKTYAGLLVGRSSSLAVVMPTGAQPYPSIPAEAAAAAAAAGLVSRAAAASRSTTLAAALPPAAPSPNSRRRLLSALGSWRSTLAAMSPVASRPPLDGPAGQASANTAAAAADGTGGGRCTAASGGAASGGAVSANDGSTDYSGSSSAEAASGGRAPPPAGGSVAASVRGNGRGNSAVASALSVMYRDLADKQAALLADSSLTGAQDSFASGPGTLPAGRHCSAASLAPPSHLPVAGSALASYGSAVQPYGSPRASGGDALGASAEAAAGSGSGQGQAGTRLLASGAAPTGAVGRDGGAGACEGGCGRGGMADGAADADASNRGGASGPGGRGGGGALVILGELGRGAQGVVYRGTWRGIDVAVKSILLQDSSPQQRSGPGSSRASQAVREAAISASISHPNIVATYTHMLTRLSASASPAGDKASLSSSSTTALATSSASSQIASDAASGRLVDTLPIAIGPELDVWKLTLVQELCAANSLRHCLQTGRLAACKPQPIFAIGMQTSTSSQLRPFSNPCVAGAFANSPHNSPLRLPLLLPLPPPSPPASASGQHMLASQASTPNLPPRPRPPSQPVLLSPSPLGAAPLPTPPSPAVIRGLGESSLSPGSPGRRPSSGPSSDDPDPGPGPGSGPSPGPSKEHSSSSSSHGPIDPIAPGAGACETLPPRSRILALAGPSSGRCVPGRAPGRGAAGVGAFGSVLLDGDGMSAALESSSGGGAGSGGSQQELRSGAGSSAEGGALMITPPGCSPLDPRLALSVALQIARGLAHLHARSIVHADVSSANVMMQTHPRALGTMAPAETGTGASQTGWVSQGAPGPPEDLYGFGLVAKLGDFGLSGWLDVAAGNTHLSGPARRSSAYSPPELARSGRAGPPGDVYALALVLWELAWGCPLPELLSRPEGSGVRAWLSEQELRDGGEVEALPPALLAWPREGGWGQHARVAGGWAALVVECLREEPRARPAAGEVVARLWKMLQSLS